MKNLMGVDIRKSFMPSSEAAAINLKTYGAAFKVNGIDVKMPDAKVTDLVTGPIASNADAQAYTVEKDVQDYTPALIPSIGVVPEQVQVVETHNTLSIDDELEAIEKRRSQLLQKKREKELSDWLNPVMDAIANSLNNNNGSIIVIVPDKNIITSFESTKDVGVYVDRESSLIIQLSEMN